MPGSRTRAVAGVLVVTVGIVAWGLRHTAPPVRPHLLAGSIWLTSRAVGELTLVDGVSAEVSASVGVTGPNGHFTTTQIGANGYAVDADGGQVVAVNGATLQKQSTRPLPQSTRDMSIYPTTSALFAVDRRLRRVQAVDPDSLALLGPAMTLPPGQVSLTADGQTLWAAATSGDLVSFTVTSGVPVRRLRPHAIPASARIDVAASDGHPVLVDRRHASATLLSGTDHLRSMRLPLRTDDLVTGSPEQDRLLVVQPARGALLACAIGPAGCGPSLVLHTVDHELGSAVEADGRAFVPDYTDRTVRIVDLTSGQLWRTETLFPDDVHFELSTHDGLVYFNDPDSERAGVISTTGLVRRINKYDPARTLAPSLNPSAHPDSSAPPTSSAQPSTAGTKKPVPVPTGSARPAGNLSPTRGGAGRPSNSAVPVTKLKIATIRWNPTTPEIGQPVAFTADLTGTAPNNWSWLVTTADGHTEATAATPQFTHTFGVAGTYTVKLAITAGPYRDELSATVRVVPPAPPVHCGDQVTTTIVLHTDLDCPGVALTVLASDVVIDLDGHTIRGPGAGNGIVAANQANVTVQNGTITGYFAALDLSTVPQSTVANLRLLGAGIHAVSHTDNLAIRGSEFRGAQINVRSSFAPAITGSTIAADSSVSLAVDTTSSLITDSAFTDSFVEYREANGHSVVNTMFTRSYLGTNESDLLVVSGCHFLQSGIGVNVDSRHTTIHDNQFIGADNAISAAGVAPYLLVQHNTFTSNRIGIALVHQAMGEFSGLTVIDNTFTENGAAGVFMDVPSGPAEAGLTISGNRFSGNGKRSGGLVDSAGRAVNDGLHVTVPPGTALTIQGNHTDHNAQYGIEAEPGTVIDGGGNVSTADPAGCLGVTCA